jgi:hypothetical protein
MDKSYKTQSTKLCFTDFIGTKRQNNRALSLHHGGDDFSLNAMTDGQKLSSRPKLVLFRLGKGVREMEN